jgi:signal transduction histidine kinase
MPAVGADTVVTAVLVAVCALLVVGRPSLSSTSIVALPGALLAFAVGVALPRRRAQLGVAALAASLQIAVGFAEFPNVEIAFVTLMPWWAGTQVRARRVLVRALAERNRELEAEEDLFVRLSVRRERAAIARELHDIVAHQLAVVVVQAGAGRMAVGARGPEIVDRFTTIRDAGVQALGEMALLVDVLQRDADSEGDGEGGARAFARLTALVEQARAGGLHVRVTAPASDVTIAREIEDGAVRVIQEGLTNAMKHAPGSEVHIRLIARDDELEVGMVDDGAGSASELVATGAGLGLTGMRERIESLGGTLEAGPRRDGGWSLQVSLPRTAAGAAAVVPVMARCNDQPQSDRPAQGDRKRSI